MLSQTFLTLALATASSAHFLLEWPPTAGFDDSVETTSPCGGATVHVNSSSPQVHVDRFAIDLFSSHPAGEWQFRGTLDTQEPYNWTDLTPVVNTTGVGAFCLNYMHAPESFAGKPGIIQVVDDSVDGILYQCAPVNFVSGMNSTLGGACTNATSFTAEWTSIDQFTDSDSSSSSSTMSMSGSSTSTIASGTASASAASTSAASGAGAAYPTMAVGSLLGGAGALVAGFLL